MKIEFFKIIYQKSKKLFRLITCGLIDIETFEQRYMNNEEGEPNPYAQKGDLVD